MIKRCRAYASAAAALMALTLPLQACGSSTKAGQSANTQTTQTYYTPPGDASTTTTSDTYSSSMGNGATTSTAQQPSATPAASADAVQLASYQENSQSNATDPLALEFQQSLDALKPVCSESSHSTAAVIWASWKDLLKNSFNVSLLHVAHALQTIGKGLSANARPTNCAALLAAYLVTAESGNGSP